MSRTNTSGLSKSAGASSTARTPSTENTKAATAEGRIERHGIAMRREYCSAATLVPQIDDVLFVPNTSGTEAARSGGRKTNSAGSWINPPPPTTESTSPATNAERQSQRRSKQLVARRNFCCESVARWREAERTEPSFQRVCWASSRAQRQREERAFVSRGRSQPGLRIEN